MALKIGDVIDGKYRIVRLLGEGGMGAVFEGENVRIKRRVAIKVLHAAVASDEESTKRFEREAQAAGRIGNEHILEVLDMGELPDGDHFMVMEFLDGESLSDRIRARGRLSPEEAVLIFRQLLEGLKAAHGAGIVHRDLKPDNVFLLREKMGQQDYVKIIDFGISKFQPLAGEMKMTRTGTVMGTPYYMSPEQASGSKEADFRSDIYAVGVMLYEALSGSVPFDAPTFNQLLFRIVLSEPAPIRQLVPELDEAFASIVAKAMARDMDRRFSSADAFILAFENWGSHGLPVTVPPVAAGEAYLPEDTRSVGTPGAFMQPPAAGTPAAEVVVGQRAGMAPPVAAAGAPADQQAENAAAGAAAGARAPFATPGGTPPLEQMVEAGGGVAGAHRPNPGGGVPEVTSGAWVNTQVGQKKSSAPLIIAVAGAAVFLGVVAASGWWLLSTKGSPSDQEQLDAGAAASVSLAIAASVPVAEPSLPASVPDEDGSPPQRRDEPGDGSPDAAVSAEAPAKTPKPPVAARPPVPTPVVRPVTKPRPAPRPARTSRPKPAGPVDFGY